jgi:hypothetical protein
MISLVELFVSVDDFAWDLYDYKNSKSNTLTFIVSLNPLPRYFAGSSLMLINQSNCQ